MAKVWSRAMVFRRLPLVIGVAAILLSTVVRAEGDLLSAEEVQKLVDAGQYRDGLKALLRILALKGSGMEVYDRYDMLMLRAECQLQIHEQAAAVDSLGAARKEAIAQKKVEKAMLPIAMTLLIQRSTSGQYKPRAGGAVISILDRTKRGEAFAALLTDELPGAKRKADGVATARVVNPMVEAAQTVGPVRAVEMTVTKKDDQTKAMGDTIVAAADRLMGSAIGEMTGQANTISQRANEIVTEQVAKYDQNSGKSWFDWVTKRRGIFPEEAETLKQIQATAGKMTAAVNDIAGALGTNLEALRALGGKSEMLRLRVASILKDDYNVIPKSER